jgi:hypothetical protein
MFWVKESDADPGLSASAAVLVLLVLMALLFNLVSGALLVREYSHLRADSVSPNSQALPTLELTQGWLILRLGLTLAATVTLLLCLGALHWLRRRNLSTHRLSPILPPTTVILGTVCSEARCASGAPAQALPYGIAVNPGVRVYREGSARWRVFAHRALSSQKLDEDRHAR